MYLGGTAMLVLAVCAAIALGVLVESFSGTTSSIAIPGADEPCRATPIALRDGASVPASDLAAVTFLRSNLAYGLTLGAIGCLTGTPTPNGGFALESERFPVRLVRSTDGGSTFSSVGAALPDSLADQFGGASLVFLDAERGFVLASGSLYATSDAGGHWQEVTLGRPVAAIGALGGRAVALTIGDWRLWWSKGHSARFSATGASAPLPPIGSSTTLVVDATADRIYLVPFVSNQRAAAVLFSADEGATWERRPSPCAPPYLPTPIALAAAPDHSLGLLCGGLGAAGSAPRAFYTSSDAGSSWVLRSEGQPDGQPDASGLPLQDFGNVLVAPRAGTFLLTTANGLFSSSDDGAHWREVANVDLGGAGGTSTFSFVTSTRGFLLTPDAGLFATSDDRTFVPR